MSNGFDYETPRPKITEAMNLEIQEAADNVLLRTGSTYAESGKRLIDVFNDDPPLNLDYASLFGEKLKAEAIDPSTQIRIGITALPVPPGRIHITEDRHTEEISGLRSRGSSLVKTGRGQIRISMPLEFPNLTAVNDSLREVIAQFRACPFLTIENDLISTAILQKQSDFAPLGEYVKAKAELERITPPYMQAKTKAIEEIARASGAVLADAMGEASLDAAKTRMNTMTADELEDVVKSVVTHLSGPVAPLPPAGMWQFLPKEQVLGPLIKKMKELWGEVLEKQTAVAQAAIKSSYAYPAVPVALQQMVCRTVPGFPERLQVNLEALYFNTSPYMSSTLFVGPTGSWTLNLGNCPTYRSWFKSRFMDNDERKAHSHMSWPGSLGKMDPKSRGLLKLIYPVPELERTTKEPRRPEVGTAGPPPPGTENENDKVYKPKTKEFFIDSKNKNIIVDQVVVSLENKLAPQPVEGAMYGTLQYMGSMNARIRIILTVTAESTLEHNKYLSEIHKIKKATEEVALMGGPKARRNARITIENEMVRLFGVQNVLLSRVTTTTKAVNTTEVALDFIEYTNSQDKRERVTRVKPEGGKKEIWRRTLKYVASLAAARVHQIGSKDVMETVSAGTTDNPGEWALDWLYSSASGVISPELLAMAFRRVVGGYVGPLDDAVREASPTWRADRKSKSLAEFDNLYKEFVADLFRPYTDWEGRRRPPEVNIARTLGARKYVDLVGDLGLGDLRRESAALKATAYRRNYRYPGGDITERYRSTVEKRYREWRRAHQKEEKEERYEYNRWVHEQTQGKLDQLAREHIVYWSRPASMPRISDYTRRFARDSTGLFVVDPLPSDKIIEKIVDILATPGPTPFKAEQTAMGGLAVHAEIRFSNLAAQIEEIKGELDTVPPYDDLDLPTYGRAYYRLWAAIKESTGYDVLESGLDSAPPKVKEVILRVVPTYEDLGERAPFGKTRKDLARGLSDSVDPDFFFFWFKIKKALRPATEDVVDKVGEFKTGYEEIDDFRIAQAEKKALNKIKLNAEAQEGTQKAVNRYDRDPMPKETIARRKPAAVELPSGLVKNLPISADLSYDNLYLPLRRELREQLEDYNPDDDKHRKRLFQEAIDDTKDEFRRMVTAFPAFKMYLIETDSQFWTLMDDFYGYNAIKSIRVFHHKYTPDLAEIEIINTTGNLDEMRADSSDKEKEDREDKIQSAQPREKTTGEPQELDHFFLDTGTPVMIRMGYSADPKRLPTRFVGQIVSVRAGDITKIVAQGYSAELTVPVSAETGRLALNVIEEVMDRSPTIHYGRWGLDNKEPGRVSALTGQVVGAEDLEDEKEVTSARRAPRIALQPEVNPALIIKKAAAEIFATRKLNNVFLPNRRFWDGVQNPGKKNWGIPNITGLEALHELTRHHPGYVVATRPYDQDATLFFGKPEQPYYFTSKHGDEESKWLKQRKAIRKRLKTDVEELIKGFLLSFQNELFTAYVQMRRSSHLYGYAKYGLERVWVGAATGAGAVYQVAGFVVSGFGLWGDKWGWGAAEKWGDAADPGDVLRQDVSRDATYDLTSINDKLGPDAVRRIAAWFFTQYGNHRMTGDMYTPGGTWMSDLFAILDEKSWFDMADPKMGLALPAEEGASPGMVMGLLADLPRILQVISQKTTTEDNTSRASEAAMKKVMGRAFEGVDSDQPAMTVGGGDIDASLYKKTARSVLAWMHEWKYFLFVFADFLQETTNVELKKAISAAAEERRILGLNPRMKRFRSHHFAHSSINIIKNDITVTKEFMANRVLIRYPSNEEGAFRKFGESLVVVQKSSDDWTSLELAFNDDIEPDQWKARVVTEPNAVSRKLAYLCAKANLAEALRSMYRGNLIVRGLASMYPYDVVWLHDDYNQTYGPIEAETVIDQMDETGYTLNIVPNALTWAEGGAQAVDCSTIGIWNSMLAMGILTAIGSVAAAPWTAGLSLTAGAAVTAAVVTHHDQQMRKKYGKTLAEDVQRRFEGFIMGSSSAGGRDSGVRIIPLVRRGRPWTAGMKGIGHGGWKKRWKDRWEAIKKGWVPFVERLEDVLF